MKRCKDILLLLSVTGLLVSAAGCDSVIYDNYPVENNPDDLVTLVLNVGLVAPTRAALPDQEMMHDLRIVLLDADGKVEYNELIGFDSGAQEYKEGVQGYQFIRTKPGEKKIFFVANEASVTAVHSTDNSFTGSPSLTYVLNQWSAGSTNGESKKFENMVKSIYFSSDYRGNIPLSSSYAFTITDADLGERVVKEFYLVHAATKFEFEFINNRLSPVQIDALSISSIANNMYLMANFGEETPAEEKQGPDGKYWIDWLKEVSKKTTENPNDTDDTQTDNETINAGYGWITDYLLPNDGHEIKTLVASDAPRNIPATARVELDVVYFPESKNLVQFSAEDQQYSFSITLTDTDPDNMIPDEVSKTKEFTLPLTNISANEKTYENLVTLFRNTHVKITCTIGYDEQDIELTLLVGICPWYEATINIPAFD